jgi:hypothetical protein
MSLTYGNAAGSGWNFQPQTGGVFCCAKEMREKT